MFIVFFIKKCLVARQQTNQNQRGVWNQHESEVNWFIIYNSTAFSCHISIEISYQ